MPKRRNGDGRIEAFHSRSRLPSEGDKIYKSLPATELRVQKRSIGQVNSNPSWSLHYYGIPLIRQDLSTNVRPVVEVPVNDNIETFLDALDFEYQFEYTTQGARYFGKMEILDRPIYVHIYEIGIVREKGEEWDYSTVLFDELVVEVFAYALDADMAVICKELTAFANRLIPIVNLVAMTPTFKKELEKLLRQRNSDSKAQSLRNM